jgi:hypothetical protein
MSDSRAAFETFISSPPHEEEILRFPDDGSSAWPGSYKDPIVDLAWGAWQASRQALEGEATAHVFPDDIKKLGSSECTVNAYSVEMGDPGRGETVPLYTHPASANAPDDAKYVRAALHLNTGSTQTPRQL